MEFIAEYKTIWLILHLFALVLGLGGATYSDLLLVKFLQDLKISKKEAEVIRTMSKVITFGILLALISGILLFLPEQERLLASSKFITKMVAFVVLTINGFALHYVVLPRLVHFSFKKDYPMMKGFLNLRQVGFIMGAISFTSWYTVFILGSLENIPLSSQMAINLYFGVLFIAIISALILEKIISKFAKKIK